MHDYCWNGLKFPLGSDGNKCQKYQHGSVFSITFLFYDVRAFNVIISEHAMRQRVVKNLFRDAIVCKTYHAQIQPQLEIFIKYSNGEVDFISLHKKLVFLFLLNKQLFYPNNSFYKPNKLPGN